MTTSRKTAGLNLSYYRTQAGLSFAALSRLLRANGVVISPRRLKRIETHTCEVYARDLIALANIFHTSTDSLVMDEPPQPNPGPVMQ